jgi:hypothetical protein
LIEEIVNQLKEFCGGRIIKHGFVLSTSMGIASDRGFVKLRTRKRNFKFFVKMARTCGDSGRIQHEADVLKKLHDMKVRDVPEIVLNGCRNGRAYFVERFLEGLPLTRIRLSRGERLSKELDWMKTFYSQTLEGTIEPRELIRRAEEVRDLASEMIDLTDALSALDKLKPATKIPSVCRHGDVTDDNFIFANGRAVAIDFACARFNEPPCEPYALVSPFVLYDDAQSLDLLSALKDINPLFLFIYENMIRLGDGLRLQEELQKNLLLDPLLFKDGVLVGTLNLPEAENLLLHFKDFTEGKREG